MLADTHIAADTALVSRDVNMTAHLSAALEAIGNETEPLTQAIIAGDCAFSSGEPGDYDQLLRLIEPARVKGMTFHLALGNHDHRLNLLEKACTYFADNQPVSDRLVTVIRGPHADWFILDSLERTLLPPGTLGASQLQWLERELDRHTDHPAIVVLHHNLDLGQEIKGITDTTALLDILQPRQHVKACFYGHTHAWSVSRHSSGLHLINLAPVAYVFKAGQPSGWVRATVKPAGMNLELRCVGSEHPLHGSTHELAWR